MCARWVIVSRLPFVSLSFRHHSSRKSEAWLQRYWSVIYWIFRCCFWRSSWVVVQSTIDPSQLISFKKKKKKNLIFEFGYIKKRFEFGVTYFSKTNLMTKRVIVVTCHYAFIDFDNLQLCKYCVCGIFGHHNIHLKLYPKRAKLVHRSANINKS